MKVLSLVLSVSFLTSLALAQGATGVAAVSGVAPQPAPEVLAGPGLPPGVRSEAISADSLDAKAVRVILDVNGLDKVAVSDVAVVEGGRIVGLYLQERGVVDLDYPSTLAYLDQLRTLHLYGNRKLPLPLLRGLPDGIKKCVHLEELLLQHNDVGTLPDAIAKLPSLKTLSLADNHLQKLSPAVAEFVTRLDPQGMTQQNAPAAPPGAPIKPRFAITERDWPAQYGAASVCLWKDDAFAAISITIDDNIAPDHEWWLEMGRKYGIRLTWFVVTEMVSDGSDPRPSYWGTWADFRKLFAAGHDIQSHTVTHGKLPSPNWPGIEGEYAESQKAIEKNVPGCRCLTVAYPDGSAVPGMVRLAKKYYIGARGVACQINGAAQTEYMYTKSVGGSIFIEPFEQMGMCMATMFEKGPYDLANFYRGWYCNHNHNVDPGPGRVGMEKKFAIIQQKVAAGQLWMALFREVCQYGQERDTAHLETTEASKGRVVLKLTDGLMDDPRFDFPLTVKVRLDPQWKTVVAAQAAKPIAAKFIEHAGDTYALVQVVPGRGEVTLTDGNK